MFRDLGAPKIWTEKPSRAASSKTPSQATSKINQTSSPGEFRILDARIVPGIADPAPFAQRWALQSARTPHSNAPSSAAQSPAIGQLHWMRFSITSWLPEVEAAEEAFEAPRRLCR